MDDARIPTTTLRGWRRFVEAEIAHFTLLEEGTWQGLDPDQREAYDDARMQYHSELIVVETSSVSDIVRQGRLLMLLNRQERGARRGMIVSGEWTTGKTTAIKQLGRIHELKIRRTHPGADRIPVVYITAPPKGSPRKLAAEFARFLGLPPIKPRQNETDITDSVCRLLTDAHTDLVIVDEIHNINMNTSAGEDLSDHLKYFTEHLPATFVYAGINVEHSGLFTGIRGSQLSGRCIYVPTQAFPYGKEWRSMIAVLEEHLRLHRHEPGTILRQSKYIHQRTGGMIGSLSHLIRASAIHAILDGSEHIDRKLMDTVRIDHAASQSASSGAGEGYVA